MIRQEPKLHFVYANVDLESFCKPDPVSQEADFAAFEDMHAKCVLRISKNADLEIRLRRDGPPNDEWMAKGIMKVTLWNNCCEIEGSYPLTFSHDKPSQSIDLMNRNVLKNRIMGVFFNVEISMKFDKWEGLKVQKIFQFDHKYLDSNLNMNVQGQDFYVRSKTIFKEIPALRDYLEQNFEPGTKKYEMNELQGEKSVQAFNTMLQVAYRCTFITNIHEVGEVLSLAFRFDYPVLKQKCEYYLMHEPETDWMQKLVFADLYNLQMLKNHVICNTVGLAQVYKDLHLNRLLETHTLRSIMFKLMELKKRKMYGDAPSTGWKPLSLPEITENRWGRLKRTPTNFGGPDPDVTSTFERFESTFMPKHIGEDLITPEFSFVEKSLDLFTYKIQLGPDHRLLFKIDWNNLQTGNFVWSVGASIYIRLTYQSNEQWEYSEQVKFDHDHQSIFFDGLHIQKVFPGGVEHLLDGLGSKPTLPKVEIVVVVENIRGLELEGDEVMDEEIDDEWILQPVRNHPIICCGKYLYVDKEVLRSKSRVFTKIFEQPYEPITIPTSVEKFDSFAQFLDILHGDDIFLHPENVFHIVEFSRSFEVEDVLVTSVNWLIKELDAGKLEKLELAVMHHVPELQRAVTESIVDVDELYGYFRMPGRFCRRMCQILFERLINLPMPGSGEDEDDQIA
ncbi:hypothetical protein CAEBREN_00395 [Caenorhabditis brenneri]|uniref:BTB domain-containing protein n=1 Tax=Caenorhabditis brenneri TaxID=135651 RepID=G0PDH4_CAEBE|nr:hypothetical protein CAEBREN_00395 [Caenorhabditis brenneri]